MPDWLPEILKLQPTLLHTVFSQPGSNSLHLAKMGDPQYSPIQSSGANITVPISELGWAGWPLAALSKQKHPPRRRGHGQDTGLALQLALPSH